MKHRTTEKLGCLRRRRRDRVFADVTRPGQTETEGLKVLAISKPGTELTLDLDATSLRLPVVGGRDGFDEAVGDGA
jgi:hypothetical protein